MGQIFALKESHWDASFNSQMQQAATQALEFGDVLYFSSLAFPIKEAERRFINPEILGRSKNVSYNPATGALGGTVCLGGDAEELKRLMARYASTTLAMLRRLLPTYGTALTQGRTSLRPAEIQGRPSSWRKDDSRLHVDSFPSQPTQGRRLLRLFCNVNPHGRARTWRIGEPFPDVAQRFWPKLHSSSSMQRHVLRWLRVTKELRSELDHYMLQIHDAMKADDDYQQSAPQQLIEFPPGSAWACYTDQVSHAAMAGQHQLEQTFMLPVEAQRDPETSPLRVLERLAGRPLAPLSQKRAA